MENFYIEAVARDLELRFLGATIGRVWQPNELTLVVDVRQSDPRLLFISVDPTNPGLYLTSRNPRDLEAAASGPFSFAPSMRKRAGNGRIVRIAKPPYDRSVAFTIETYDSSGETVEVELVVELTGRSANAYLLDSGATVLAAVRTTKGQRFNLPGDQYRRLETLTPENAPDRLALLGKSIRAELISRGSHGPAVTSLERDLSLDSRGILYADGTLATFPLISKDGVDFEELRDVHAAAEARDLRRGALHLFRIELQALASRVNAALDRVKRALAALEGDVIATEGAERYRELGESLLAQVGTARTTEDGLVFTDYYADPPVDVTVEADRGETPQLVAARLFAKYQKARRTREQAQARRALLEGELGRLIPLEERLARASTVEALDEIAPVVDQALGARAVRRKGEVGRDSGDPKGARRFVSSDGFEILVGRTSAANDSLTFKVARPSDLWLHAADYPGSHVIVRNPTRQTIPHRTILEAAQLAAFYSRAAGNNLVDVRYTPRRYVNKIKGGAPGLVRLAEFKSVAVAPSATLDRVRE